jgi:hypothetical protein
VLSSLASRDRSGEISFPMAKKCFALLSIRYFPYATFHTLLSIRYFDSPFVG